MATAAGPILYRPFLDRVELTRERIFVMLKPPQWRPIVIRERPHQRH